MSVISPLLASPAAIRTQSSGCEGMGLSLASVDAGDIVTAMAGFRDGSLPATVMNRIAKGFSDDESRAIAAWLAAQK